MKSLFLLKADKKIIEVGVIVKFLVDQKDVDMFICEDRMKGKLGEALTMPENIEDDMSIKDLESLMFQVYSSTDGPLMFGLKNLNSVYVGSKYSYLRTDDNIVFKLHKKLAEPIQTLFLLVMKLIHVEIDNSDLKKHLIKIIQDFELKIDETRRKRNEFVKAQQYGSAARPRDEERQLLEERRRLLETCKEEWEENNPSK